MATETEILSTLETLASIFDTEPANVEAYLWTLEEYDADILKQAARQYVKANKWYPKPAELVALAAPLQSERNAEGTHRLLYWRTMSLLSANLRGTLDAAELERSKEYRTFINGALAETHAAAEEVYELDMQAERNLMAGATRDLPDNTLRLGRAAEAARV